MKWEAHKVRPKIQATMFVMACFPQFLIPSHPTDHHCAHSVWTNDMTDDYSEHDDMNPMKGLGATQRGEPSHQMATNSNSV